ncbi:ZIP family metal transporter [Knoellia aerolata]|uniref:ZIP family zinc transporter n=1 Tax=Knoellia aerolata DSM 18566 TaxID=1385519 RepID=A0A0A0K0M7_9MICO|nr:ZIP family zinc transporter [Knoellia aerolata]KGN42978.1 ZIP family zinc transporter [Knoellia aerolata DSM 18566]
MPVWAEAGLWGLLAGAALVLGAGIAWFVKVPQRVVATVMAFGAGVLISALSFDLVDEAESVGGLVPTAAGFMGGAVIYVAANVALAKRGARHRKRSHEIQGSEEETPGSGAAIAIGALLDGIPESIVLGLSLLGGGGAGIPVFAAIFLSNLPEGLSSAAGMKVSGRSARYVFGVWATIAITTGLAGLLGVLLLEGAAPETVAAITALAAGAILAMVADTMIPEAFEKTHMYAGLAATVGFMAAFVLSHA